MNGEKYSQAANSYAIALANGGYTLKPSTLTTPSRGFIVGGISPEVEAIHAKDFTLSKFVSSFNEVVDFIEDTEQRDLYVGGWLHEGKWYVEPVQVVEQLSDAIYLGRWANQTAIWDVANKIEIRLDNVKG